jgi:hypothetical protein
MTAETITMRKLMMIGNQVSQESDDFIKYWTEYAVLPQKCIHMNNKDVIVLIQPLL